ncbi:MAG: VWA domain-containing protein [Armatimonadetes bacterium]|nr:VWA domain-containing protein [Armatimonadota bacterium]
MFVSLALSLALMGEAQSAMAAPGQLVAPPDREGGSPRACPLKSTDVTVDIAGIAARVTLVQTFTNPYKTPIEAVYTFPMRSGAAVDRMRIKIGDRVIEGEIKRAEEARMIYDAARAAGQIAALLDQERPNIFTQSVANIMPGVEVQVEISYVEVLDYEDGEFEFVFPMVVGPRNTMNAQDPGKIFPPITPEGTRTGADISLNVTLDAGAPLDAVKSQLHAIDVKRQGKGKFRISLSRKDEIPNRDFILRWSPAGDGLQESFLTHASDGQGTFCLTILPPKIVTDQYVSPREVIFVMDESGSQQGFPIEKSKELTIAMIDRLRPDDTFNVLTFRTGVNFLWPQSMPSTTERIREAKQFVSGLTGRGGTNFIPPLNATISKPPTDGRLKLVVFNSDGYVGDDFEILSLVKKYSRNARLFTFGIGNSVNRFLIDGMSAEGRGASEIVTLATDVGPAIERFIQRTQSPVLIDVQVRVEGGDVYDLTPEAVPDMFSHGPLVVFGRYSSPGPAKIMVAGWLNGKPWTRTIDVVLPVEGDSGDGITKVWARRRLDDMVREDWMAAAASVRASTSTDRDSYESDPEPMIRFALEHGIMSQWTSFVAVEKRVVNIGGKLRTVRVPVEMAEGVSYEGVFGRSQIDGALSYLLGQGRGSSTSLSRGSRGGGGAGVAAISGGAIQRNIRIRHADPTLMRDILTGAADASILKIHKDLRNKKEGKLEVQVMVKEWPDYWKKMLEGAGLKIEDSVEGLKVVFGTIDAKMLEALAKLEFVTEIRPIDDETDKAPE